MKTKVIKIYEHGSVEVLKIEENEIDKLDLNDVLIEHSYAGLNFIDINQRRGTYPLKKLPQIMGMEASGIVKEVGENVSKFKIGDKVTLDANSPHAISPFCRQLCCRNYCGGLRQYR